MNKTKRTLHRPAITERDWSKAKYLHPAVIAEELGVSVDFVLSLIERQKLKAHKLEKGTIRIPKDAYARFLKETELKFPGRKQTDYSEETIH